MIEEIKQQLRAHNSVIEHIEHDMTKGISDLVEMLKELFRSGGKLLVMGNGGSAADAQHFVAEIVGRFKLERAALPAIALTTDTSILTAIGNDYGYDSVFSRQVEALATDKDLVVGISTSGNSGNIMKALKEARLRGSRTVGLLGKDGGCIKDVCDLALIVPSDDTPRIQEGHITIIHIVCDLTERALFAK